MVFYFYSLKHLKTILFALLGTALIIAGAKLNLNIGEIPITLQVPVIVAVGALAGWRVGLFSSLLYMLLGIFLPVFAGDTYGMDVYGGGTVGFIAMFPVAGYLSGKIAFGSVDILKINGALLLSQTLVMVGGVIGLLLVKDLTFTQAFKYGFTDLALIGYGKMVVTALVIWMIKR